MLSRVICRGAVEDAPDDVWHWAVLGCCPGYDLGCSGLCLPLGGVRAGCCPGCYRGVLLRGAVQGAPDYLCHGALQDFVQRCY